MALLPPLPAPLADDVLRFLDVPAPRPDRDWLDTLLQQYGRRVPWESASRIARTATLPMDRRPLLPEAFWRNALTAGTGGTCFESNGALSALLAAVGFDGYLTVNDMADTRACHTAIIVGLGDERVVIDAGYPMYAALPLGPGPTSRTTPWFRYDVSPLADRRYRIENHPHPTPYLFDLRDQAVSGEAYLEALRRDYQPGGLFLDRVVIRKLVSERVCRFPSHERPWRLRCFVDGRREEYSLSEDVDEAATQLAHHFGMDASTIAVALRATSGHPSRRDGPT